MSKGEPDAVVTQQALSAEAEWQAYAAAKRRLSVIQTSHDPKIRCNPKPDAQTLADVATVRAYESKPGARKWVS